MNFERIHVVLKSKKPLSNDQFKYFFHRKKCKKAEDNLLFLEHFRSIIEVHMAVHKSFTSFRGKVAMQW